MYGRQRTKCFGWDALEIASEFVAAALHQRLIAQKRTNIDAAFTGMANDAEDEAEFLVSVSEFTVVDWEAFDYLITVTS